MWTPSSSSASPMRLRNPQSYMGYFQCMYAFNAAHSKFIRTVFPAARALLLLLYLHTPYVHRPPRRRMRARMGARPRLLSRACSLALPRAGAGGAARASKTSEGPVEELIVDGTVFGFGLSTSCFPASLRRCDPT
ncbi:hypothetical protein C8R44DRAFT_810895 [Mycena epipterygia]|nr:hypothetical protein C8R44DRAFT_810895 [Mycena epipterygia]